MNNVFSLQEIFAVKILQVPHYQRGYAWEQRQLDELLEDLEFLAVGKDHYIGNLTLTFDNSVYGNRPFPEKRGDLDSTKPCYATSPMFMERSLASALDDWTEVAVVKRSEQIRDWALNRWRIESSDLPKNAEAIAEEEPTEIELL